MNKCASTGQSLGLLAMGLLCVLGYHSLSDTWMTSRLSAWADAHQMNTWDVSMGAFLLTFSRNALKGFPATYIRIVLWLIPAMAFLYYGVLGLTRDDAWLKFLRFAVNRASFLVAILAVLASALSFVIAANVLTFHPITQGDEFSYLFQAKLFAMGHFYADAPSVATEAFRNRAFVMSDRWYGIGFGGHPAALRLGMLFGSAYVAPALCAGISVILTYLFVRKVYDRATGLLAALMLTLSPLFIFYHATLLPESTNLVLLLTFMLFIAKSTKSGNIFSWIIAAIALALAIITRPQTTVITALPIGVWLLLRKTTSLRAKSQPLAILGLGVIIGILGLFTYAHLANGEPLGSHASPGYHHDEVGGATALGIKDAYTFLCYSLFSVVTWVKTNFVLLGWPVSLLALVWWLRKTNKTTWDYILFASAAGIFWMYWMYPTQHEQYFVEAGQILTTLAAVGAVAIHRQRSNTLPQRSVACFVLACYLIAFASVWPFRIAYFSERSNHERQVQHAIAQANLHHAIVFLDNLDPAQMNCVGRNSPTLDDDVLLAKLFNPTEALQIANMFPNRQTYRLYRDTEDDPIRLEPYNIPAQLAWRDTTIQSNDGITGNETP